MTEQQIANTRRWIEALRSGKYTQGRTRLRTKENEFCCLGVAACLIPRVEWTRDEDGDWYIEIDGTRSFAFLPSNIREEFGLTGVDGGTLADLNDSRGWNFNQIADFIEKNLLPAVSK